jgi:DNA-binding NarL/FixJ family response regulator
MLQQAFGTRRRAGADEAIAIAAEVTPRIAIVDIRLIGQRDGVDAAIQLLKDFGVRSIFATAHDDPSIRTRADEAKPLGWMVKPYDPRQLVTLVQQMLTDHPRD